LESAPVKEVAKSRLNIDSKEYQMPKKEKSLENLTRTEMLQPPKTTKTKTKRSKKSRKSKNPAPDGQQLMEFPVGTFNNGF